MYKLIHWLAVARCLAVIDLRPETCKMDHDLHQERVIK